MSKKKHRLVKAKAIKKLFRRNGGTIGITALAASGVAAVAMIPGVRAQVRRLTESVLSRLEERWAGRDERRLQEGPVSEHAH